MKVQRSQMSVFSSLREKQYNWFVTGAAGFIGSHLIETLLSLGQNVVGFDDFSTGTRDNLSAVETKLDASARGRLTFFERSICDFDQVLAASSNSDFILHQAAIASVPFSIENPVRTHAVNVSGFLNVLEAARTHKIKRLIYASSSAVYGNCPDLPLVETSAGAFQSPYAATKWINEAYARAYAASFGIQTVGLRYFNVFGPRQDPNGGYAAVIPKWIAALLVGDEIVINGSGEQTRDFCFVDDVVAANLHSAMADLPIGAALTLNVGTGTGVSLIQLHANLAALAARFDPQGALSKLTFGKARAGDIVHSLADISATKKAIAFAAQTSLDDGLEKTMEWFATECV